MQQFPEYQWLPTVLPSLQPADSAMVAAREVGRRDPELSAMWQTTVTPTMLQAGEKINVIPNVAVAHLDVRRLPTERRKRFRTVAASSTTRLSASTPQAAGKCRRRRQAR